MGQARTDAPATVAWSATSWDTWDRWDTCVPHDLGTDRSAGRLPGTRTSATIDEGQEVVIVTSNAEWSSLWPAASEGHVPAEEQALRQGVQPITSTDDLARPGTFESDEELEEFLTDLYASRRSGLS